MRSMTMVWTTALVLALAAPLLAKGKPGGGGGGGPPGGPPSEPAVVWYWDGALYVANADGSGAWPCVEAPSGTYVNPARWTPDGRLLVASDVWGPGLYVMQPDGSGRQQIFTPNQFQSGTRPDWSPVATPDGGPRIVFNDRPDGSDTGSELYVIRPDGSDRINLTNSPDRYEAAPCWSHDAKRLAFWDVGAFDVIIAEVGVVDGTLAITSETSLLAQLPPGTIRRPVQPAWGKTGDRLVLRAEPSPDGIAEIWLYDLAKPGQLLNLSQTSRAESWPSWTAGDAQVSFTDAQSSLVVVAPDGSGNPVLIARKARDAAWRR